MSDLAGLIAQLRTAALVDDWHTFDAVCAEALAHQLPADIVLPPLPPIADVFTVSKADYIGTYANDHARAAVLLDRERRG